MYRKVVISLRYSDFETETEKKDNHKIMLIRNSIFVDYPPNIVYSYRVCI